MSTKEEYLQIRNTNNSDITPALNYFYKLRTGKDLSDEEFGEEFTIWFQLMAYKTIVFNSIWNGVFELLDNHFEIEK